MLARKFTDNKLAAALAVVVFVLGLSIPDHAKAQDSDAENDKPPKQETITRDQLIAFIANEVLLAPGVGLRNIRLGEVLAVVRNRLGPPANVSKRGLFKRTNALLYELDGGTEVTLSGRKEVSLISVSGNSSALVRTVQGARFGMDRSLIQRIYRTPSKSRDNRLEYKHFGVTFFFDDTGLSRIDLYPRKA